MREQSISDREFEMLGFQPYALLTAARRHETTLHRINVAPLSAMGGLSGDYLRWFDHLFLLTFFYDYCLDRSGEEQYPEAFFISANMYSEYRSYVATAFGDHGLDILDRRNAEQVYYQTIEKQWENPGEYNRTHPDYSQYYKKQILCLAHIELLSLDNATEELSGALINLYKNYWSLVLLIDDIMDVDRDIASKTLTPMIADFYAEHGVMPKCADADTLRQKWMSEIDRLSPEFERAMSELGAYDYLYIIGDLRDRLQSNG